MIISMVWMINTRGRPVQVESTSVPHLKEQGFMLLSGEPKQHYYPQFDNSNGTRTTQPPEIDDLTEILEFEIL